MPRIPTTDINALPNGRKRAGRLQHRSSVASENVHRNGSKTAAHRCCAEKKKSKEKTVSPPSTTTPTRALAPAPLTAATNTSTPSSSVLHFSLSSNPVTHQGAINFPMNEQRTLTSPLLLSTEGKPHQRFQQQQQQLQQQKSSVGVSGDRTAAFSTTSTAGPPTFSYTALGDKATKLQSTSVTGAQLPGKPHAGAAPSRAVAAHAMNNNSSNDDRVTSLLPVPPSPNSSTPAGSGARAAVSYRHQQGSPLLGDATAPSSKTQQDHTGGSLSSSSRPAAPPAPTATLSAAAAASGTVRPNSSSATRTHSQMQYVLSNLRASMEEGGYYVPSDDASDDDVNSSFSESSAHNNGAAVLSDRGRVLYPSHNADTTDAEGYDDEEEDDGDEYEDNASYDEEDEEQAVQRYMDSGAVDMQSISCGGDGSDVDLEEDQDGAVDPANVGEGRASVGESRRMLAAMAHVSSNRTVNTEEPITPLGSHIDHAAPRSPSASAASVLLASVGGNSRRLSPVETCSDGGVSGNAVGRSAVGVAVGRPLRAMLPHLCTPPPLSAAAPAAVVPTPPTDMPLASSSDGGRPSGTSQTSQHLYSRSVLLPSRQQSAGSINSSAGQSGRGSGAAATLQSSKASVREVSKGTVTSAVTPNAAAAAAAGSPVSQAEAEVCRRLSLFDAFFFDKNSKMWLVDDLVLAKCLEYVRLMGYEHPLMRRDRAINRPSIWSSSAAVPSPLVACATETAVLSSELPSFVSGAALADFQQGLTATPTTTTSSGGSDDRGCHDGVQRAYRLKCGGTPRSATQRRSIAAAGECPLFLSYSEAYRWLSEQEYVIGTILMCCAKADPTQSFSSAAPSASPVMTSSNPLYKPSRCATGGSATTAAPRANGGNADPRSRGEGVTPAIPCNVHPILWAARLVLTKFSGWGSLDTFAQTWERQTHLVLGSAAPLHQRVFAPPSINSDGIVFISDFEGGNLARVERAVEPYFYYLWLDPDSGSDKRIWFRFAIAGALTEGRTLRFRLLNAAPHAKLYRQHGMMPVWRDGLTQPHWTAVDQCSFRTTNGDLDGEVSFSIVPRSPTETIQVAFCAPYTYSDLLCHICNWHTLVRNSVCRIRFEERVLCRTPDGRKLHLLIITSPTAMVTARRTGGGGGGGGGAAAGSPTTSGGFADIRGPYANFATGKKVVLISGRVHPGEVTASHAAHGLISFLLSSDPRAARLREHFLFFIVPMLNPDGVSRGHSRLDQYGMNLNRCYNQPDPVTQPTVHALRKVFEHLQRNFRERFIMYVDFHSHASQSSGFMFGNHLPIEVQHWNMVFPKMVELHARDVFSFSLCRFGRTHMSSKDGASRVLFGSSLIHSYTVELAYFTDRRMYSDTFAALNNGGSVVFDDAAGSSAYPAMSVGAGVLPGAGAGAMNGAAGAGLSSGSPGRKNGGEDPLHGASRRANTPVGGTTSSNTSRKRTSTSHKYRSNSEGGSQRRGRRGMENNASSSNSGASVAGGVGSLIPPPGMLRGVAIPSVLCQSAAVGQACMLALLDYCSVGVRASNELVVYGGMERVLLEVKRQMRPHKGAVRKPPTTAACAMQPIFKQY